MSGEIHPTAIIEDGAQIGEGTTIGPYSIVRANVVLGKRNVIGPHVVIEGSTTLGDDNRVFQFASVGAIPQDLKYNGEASRLEIGSRNIIREFTTLHIGTKGGGMLTRIGNQNLFMANCHIGHDSYLGDYNVVANSVAVAGHVTVGNRTILGGLAAIHQFVRLGDLCLVGGGTMAVQDIPPFCLAQGDRAGLAGINRIGMERAGYSREDIAKVRHVFREVFLSKGPFKDRVLAAHKLFPDNAPSKFFLDFLEGSKRGITHLRLESRLAVSEDL